MRTVLVTGANRGIGLELCRQFARRGEDIIATCRKASPELRETGAEIYEGIDVTDNNLVHGLARALQGRRIDILVNSAGENFGRGPRTPRAIAKPLVFYNDSGVCYVIVTACGNVPYPLACKGCLELGLPMTTFR